jgi:hypothetical protein
MHLHAQCRDLVGDVGGEGFRQRRQQPRAGIGFFARGLVLGFMRNVDRDRGGVADRARGGGEDALGPEVALYVWMHGDGIGFAAFVAERAALLALLGISERLLRRALRDADAL